LVFDLAARLVTMMPGDIEHVFFTNSGSESCDTAMKIALAYHRANGEGTRTKFIGRERGYHGCSFGGISVGGISPNRKAFGGVLLATDHMPHTHNLEHNAFTKGQPEWGAHLADDLERLILLHDPSNVAAVMVEPFAGSAGVLLPPKGYLDRLRAITEKYGILLIFDEVITGFGRLGAASGSEFFGVVPDIMSTAKGITNGTVPMGAVFVRKHLYETVVSGPENLIELFHGYTYSGHPLACAAAMATLDVYQGEDLFNRVNSVAPHWENALHGLAGLPNVIDIRNLGLVGAVELDPIPGSPGARAYDVFLRCYEKGVLVRFTGDIIALTPPLIIELSEIDRIAEVLGEAITENARE
ncbi:MAG: aminotransferase class III-fold pyridoxal phosphate-dependent enzyme, partial [Pseudomonadota bacterium]